MDENERDEILYRLDERTKRVDEHLKRVEQRVSNIEDDVEEHESRITENGNYINGIIVAVGSAGSVMLAGISALFTKLAGAIP